jgi:hypothetical protein
VRFEIERQIEDGEVGFREGLDAVVMRLGAPICPAATSF